MNIWTRLGISVALAAIFYIAMAELVQNKLFYQHHKWRICAGLVIAGIALFPVGLGLNARMKRRYDQAQAALAPEDRQAYQTFLLTNVTYWGVMFVFFGVIVIFITPSYRAPEKRVAAKAPPVPTPTNPPSFKFQGMTLRGSNASALINGRTYFIGEQVGEAKVISISTNQAILEWRGIKLVLPAPQ